MVQLSHPYMTTGKTIALTRRMFAGNVSVMSLLFNMSRFNMLIKISRFVIDFPKRSNGLLLL